MRKSLLIAVTLFLSWNWLFIKTGFSLPVAERYPEVPNSAVNTLFCYMQTTNRRVLDLSRLCQGTSTKPVKPGVVVIELNRSGENLVGRVRNDTGKTVRYVIVNYQVVNAKDQKPEAASFTFVNPESLKPGEIGRFDGILRGLGEVKVTSVEWETSSEENSSRS